MPAGSLRSRLRQRPRQCHRGRPRLRQFRQPPNDTDYVGIERRHEWADKQSSGVACYVGTDPGFQGVYDFDAHDPSGFKALYERDDFEVRR